MYLGGISVTYHFRNLQFEGGGVKGIAYVGVMEALQKRKVLDSIERVGGTSSGAINALFLGLNYSLAQIKNILITLDFSNFLDDTWGIVRDTTRLISEYGWYKGDYFRNWVADLVYQKTGNPDATFNDCKKQGFRDMYFVGTNISTGFSEVFSFEHTPRMCLADAVRISMSIPLFFAAKRSLRGDVYVDGGVLDNYPIKLFDRKKYVKQFSSTPEYYDKLNKKLKQEGIEIDPYVFNQETLGFRLNSAQEIGIFRDHAEPDHRKIEDFFSYAWSLISTIMNNQENQHLHSDDWQRTIYIDTLGVSTIEFGLSRDKKEALIESGRLYTDKYFKWYDNPQNNPANRPNVLGGV